MLIIHYKKAWGIALVLIGGFEISVNVLLLSVTIGIIGGFCALILGLLYLNVKCATVEPNLLKVYAPLGFVRKTYPFQYLVVEGDKLYTYLNGQRTKVAISAIMMDNNDWDALSQGAYRF